MVTKVSLSDEFLEHCLTSTPTLEGVKAFLASDEYYTYWRYWMKEEEERQEAEEEWKRNVALGKLEAQTEVVTNLLLDGTYSVQFIAECLKLDIKFVEKIKSNLKL
jgi:hypothetical protein